MVAASHLAANMPVRPESGIAAAAWRTIQLGANGRVAVALFFVISGFCIHLGQVSTLRVDPINFLVRRGVRIGLPLAATITLSASLGPWAIAALKLVLWSVYCELIYYAAYPALLAIRRKISMGRLIGFFSTISAAAIAASLHFRWDALEGPPTVAYFLPLFPLWLLGAWLAERHGLIGGKTSSREIWCWRVGAIAFGFAANQAKLYDLQLASWLIYIAVGLFCWSYLPRELGRWAATPPWLATEQLGKASYTLYLIHILPIALMLQLKVTWSFAGVLAAQCAAIALANYCIYRLCEAPAHQLARSISWKLCPRAVAEVTPA
jgi:peptidoglycan/LPS O-acetylase OafA/YrhL